MTPGKYDIAIHRGGTYNISLESKDANDIATDFSVYDEILMQIRPPWIKGIPAKSPLLELSLVNGRIALSNLGQTVDLTISAQVTAGLTFDEGRYELEFVKHADLGAEPPIPEEIVDKLLYGSVTVTGEIAV